ncbi:ApeA N-terminal domain 1-containing protein [Streptomyces sp. DW26H14]|uniref:ApeA N-terminal domain 1-containing protein n=1 Tax=Streptomyces sp. DW26H14 TaxID=3435395 RepID=UPI00403D8766
MPSSTGRPGTARDGKDITLVDVTGHYLPGMTSSEETYRPGLALVNAHVTTALFTEARGETDHLADWVNAPSAVRSAGRDWSFSMETTKITDAHIPDGSVAITTGLYGSGSDTWVDFAQQTHFDVSTHTPLPWRDMLPSTEKAVASARVSVSHGGASSVDATRRYWLGEVLSWITRCRVLDAVGVSGIYEKAVRRHAFRHAVGEVGRATD